MMGRSRAKAWRFLFAVALALAASAALGTEAPHDITNLPNACEACHVAHNAVGGGLTSTAGNANLCKSCHDLQSNFVVLNWQTALAPTGNQAVPGTGGSSHRWDAPGFEPKFGTTTANLVAGTLDSSGNLMCSSCHDQHKQTKKPFDIRSPATGAGRHFMAVDNDAAQLCTSCHSQWNYTNVGGGTPYLCAVSPCTTANGTASFTAGGTTVSGNSSNFKTGGLKAGWRIKKAADPVTAFTVIKSVNSDTSLTLASGYLGTAGTNVAWEAAPTLSHPSNLAVTGSDFKAPPYDSPFYGTATGGSATTVTLDGTQFVWATNALSASAAPRYIRFTSGNNKDLVCSITGNSTSGGTTTITLVPLGGTALQNAPVGGATPDTFEIGRVVTTSYGKATAAGSTTTIVDSTKAGWPNLSGATVTMLAGTNNNVGVTRTIGSVSGGTITLSSALPSSTALGDLYRINWGDSGTSTAAGATGTTITDTSRSWVTNALANLTVRITTRDAAYVGATSTIASNTATQITLRTAISGLQTTGGDTYEIGPAQAPVHRGTATSGSTTTLTDSTKSWTSGWLVGLSVRFLGQYNQGVVGSGNQGVISTITANTATQITFTAVGTPVAAGNAYEIDHDGNMTNNLPLADTLATSFTAGNVVCLSCHAAHFADSSSSTYDAAPPAVAGAGDGKLLRRDNDDRFCTSCHAVKIHNSVNTSNRYGTWGETFTCFRCHQPHETTNLFLVRQQIVTPSSGTLAVDFRNTTGKATYSYAAATGAAPYGPCEVCHTQTKNPTTSVARYRNTGNPDGHETGGCVGCHQHVNGFAAPPSGGGESGGGAACGACHGSILDSMDGTVAKTSKHTLVVASDGPSDNGQSWSALTNLIDVPASNRQCINMCHSDHPHDLSGSTHEWNVYLDAVTGTSRSNGGANNSTTTRDNTDFDSTQTNGGMCVSCHQTRVDATKPAIPKATYAASAHNTTTAFGTTTPWSYKLHDGGIFQRNCTKCHSDRGDANPQATTFGAVHYTGYPQLLGGNTRPATGVAQFICYNCHGNSAVISGTANLSGKDIATQLAKTYKHPVASDQWHDTVAEPPTSAGSPNPDFSGTNRHVNCIDCHDAHQTQAAGSGARAGTASYASGTPATLTDTSKAWTTNQWKGWSVRITSSSVAGAVGQTSVIYENTATTLKVMFDSTKAPALTGNGYVIVPIGIRQPATPPGATILAGAWGVQPTYATPPAPPTWNDSPGIGTNPPAQITNQYPAYTAYSFTAVTSPTTEGYLCIKCHSSYAWGGTPPAVTVPPAGGTAINQGDKLNEFNPNNLAHHAVFAKGKNQPMKSSATENSFFNPNWPKYTGTVSSVSGTTVTMSSNVPVNVLPGWFIYIGSSTPADGKNGGSAGWYEVVAVPSSTTLTIDRSCAAPSVCSGTPAYLLTPGLGANFVPPFGPWSVIDCTDCHTGDATTDPLGPHGSTNKYVVAGSKAITFLDGTGAAVTSTPADTVNVCINCHWRDVYGDQSFTGPAHASYSRQTHPVDRAGGDATKGTYNSWGIGCMNCHGGARVGEIHGSNLGRGGGLGTPSYSGKRLLAGANWYGLKRSVGATAGQCWVKGSADTVTSCKQGHTGSGFGTGGANYYYDEVDP